VIAKVEHHLGELFPRVGFIVTTFTGTTRAVVRFYNHRGTAEQWIKEGKEATHWTRLSCHRFRADEVRLLLGVIAYNLGNLLRRLVLPVAIQRWSLTSLRQRLFKTGGRLIRHARYFVLQLAESHLTGTLFRQIIGRIERLAWHPTCERGRCDVLRTRRTAMEHHVVPLAAQEERSTGLSRKSRTKFGIFINLKWRKRSDCPEAMP
jgi:hypothetical protein